MSDLKKRFCDDVKANCMSGGFQLAINNARGNVFAACELLLLKSDDSFPKNTWDVPAEAFEWWMLKAEYQELFTAEQLDTARRRLLIGEWSKVK
jgi:hypothetical protein